MPRILKLWCSHCKRATRHGRRESWYYCRKCGTGTRDEREPARVDQATEMVERPTLRYDVGTKQGE